MVIIYLYPFFCFQWGSKLRTIIGTGGGLLLIDPGITQLRLERGLEVTQPIFLVTYTGKLRPTWEMFIVSHAQIGRFLLLWSIPSTEEGSCGTSNDTVVSLVL